MERPFEGLVKRFAKLEGIYGLYEQAEQELVGVIGVPVCMANCGKCCEHNTVLPWGIEVEHIASYLLAEPVLMKKVLDRCEEWLRYNDGPVPSVKKLRSNPKSLMERVHRLTAGPCPLLENHSCLIYKVRPAACQAFGVTTYPRNCPRPVGYGETIETRAYNRGMGLAISEAMDSLLLEAAGDANDVTVGFLPTLIMSRLKAREFAGLVDSGKVDPIKLVRNFVSSPSILSEAQLTDLSLAGDKALQGVEKKGILTGPLSFKIK